MSSNAVLVSVIGVLSGLLVLALGFIAYLVKRIIDEKPIAVQPAATPDARPQVTTRADLKAERKWQEEQNFKDQPQFADLEDLPASVGQNLLEQMSNGGSE